MNWAGSWIPSANELPAATEGEAGRETVRFTLIALHSKPCLLAHLCCYYDVQILDLILKGSKSFQLPLSLMRDECPQHFPYVFKVKDSAVIIRPSHRLYRVAGELHPVKRSQRESVFLVLQGLVIRGLTVSTKTKPQLTPNNYRVSLFLSVPDDVRV